MRLERGHRCVSWRPGIEKPLMISPNSAAPTSAPTKRADDPAPEAVGQPDREVPDRQTHHHPREQTHQRFLPCRRLRGRDRGALGPDRTSRDAVVLGHVGRRRDRRRLVSRRRSSSPVRRSGRRRRRPRRAASAQPGAVRPAAASARRVTAGACVAARRADRATVARAAVGVSSVLLGRVRECARSAREVR